VKKLKYIHTHKNISDKDMFSEILPVTINGFLVSYLRAWPIQIARMPLRWKMTDPYNKQSGKTKKQKEECNS